MGRKSHRRSNRNDEETQGIHPVSSDVVEIERNLIEKWLLSLKHTARMNPKTTRYLVLSIISAAVLLLVLIFTHTYIKRSHNENFYYLMSQINEVQKLPDGEIKNSQLVKKGDEAAELCNSFWMTESSYNGCLAAASAYIKAGRPAKAASVLENYTDEYTDEGYGPVVLFQQAHAYEAAGELEKAEKVYSELGPVLKKIKKEDLSIFHRGRVLYYLGRYDEAAALLEKVINDFENSAYSDRAAQYLTLTELKQN